MKCFLTATSWSEHHTSKATLRFAYGKYDEGIQQSLSVQNPGNSRGAPTAVRGGGLQAVLQSDAVAKHEGEVLLQFDSPTSPVGRGSPGQQLGGYRGLSITKQN